jgi:hypothetical protein
MLPPPVAKEKKRDSRVPKETTMSLVAHPVGGR